MVVVAAGLAAWHPSRSSWGSCPDPWPISAATAAATSEAGKSYTGGAAPPHCIGCCRRALPASSEPMVRSATRVQALAGGGVLPQELLCWCLEGRQDLGRHIQCCGR